MNTRKLLITAGALTAFGFGLTAQDSSPGQPQSRQPGVQEEQPRQQQTGQQGIREREQQTGQQGTRERQQQTGQQRMQERQTGQQRDQAATGEIDAQRISDIDGSRVVNSDGDRLGTVDDLAIGLEDGSLDYVMISAGGFLGIGGDLHPVPPQALQVREVTMGVEVLLDMTEEEWENAPTIEREQIHTLSQDSRAEQIYQFYGEDWQAHQERSTEFAGTQREGQQESATENQETESEFGSPTRERDLEQQQQQGQDTDTEAGQLETPTEEEETENEFGSPTRERETTQRQQQQEEESSLIGDQEELRAASELNLAGDLMNASIQDSEQQELGEISDFLVNLEDGRVLAALVSTATGFWDMEGQEFAVSPSAFEVENNDLVLNVTQDDFERAEIVTSDRLHTQLGDSTGTEARQSPQVFRYQETTESGPGVYGAPGEDRDADAQIGDPETEGRPGADADAGTEGSPGTGAGTNMEDRDTDHQRQTESDSSTEFGSPDRDREAEREEVRRELGVPQYGESEGREYPDRQEERTSPTGP